MDLDPIGMHKILLSSPAFGGSSESRLAVRRMRRECELAYEEHSRIGAISSNVVRAPLQTVNKS